jgi:hypothetical protein
MSDMRSDEQQFEIDVENIRVIKTEDAAEILGIAGPTIRNYCQELEKKGYPFRKAENGARLFTPDNLVDIKDIFRLVKEKKIGKETAIDIVAMRRLGKKEGKSPIQQASDSNDKGLPVEEIQNLHHEIRYIRESMQGLEEAAAALASRKQMDYLLEKIEGFMDSYMETIKSNQGMLEEYVKTKKENDELKETTKEMIEYIRSQKDKKPGILDRLLGRGKEKD